MRIALEHLAVLLAVLRGRNGRTNGGFDFLRCRPDVFQVDRFARSIVAEGFRGEVQVHAPRKRVSDNEGWRGQIIGANQRMNAALKVAIAAEDRNSDQIVVLDGGADGFRQWAAVADASRAPISDQVKVQFLEI